MVLSPHNRRLPAAAADHTRCYQLLMHQCLSCLGFTSTQKPTLPAARHAPPTTRPSSPFLLFFRKTFCCQFAHSRSTQEQVVAPSALHTLRHAAPFSLAAPTDLPGAQLAAAMLVAPSCASRDGGTRPCERLSPQRSEILIRSALARCGQPAASATAARPPPPTTAADPAWCGKRAAATRRSRCCQWQGASRSTPATSPAGSHAALQSSVAAVAQVPFPACLACFNLPRLCTPTGHAPGFTSALTLADLMLLRVLQPASTTAQPASQPASQVGQQSWGGAPNMMIRPPLNST